MNSPDSNDRHKSAQIEQSKARSRQSDSKSYLGSAMVSVTKSINDNIIVFRYTTFSLIALIGAYGFSKTPLFSRFKSINEIPISFFKERKSIHCRIVHIIDNSSTLSPEGFPITFLVRHLSPIERLCTLSVFNWTKKLPKTNFTKQKDLLRVELAGIVHPPQYFLPQHMEKQGEWLHRLVDSQPPVIVKLKAKRIRNQVKPHTLEEHDRCLTQHDIKSESIVCFIKYRPASSIFRKDLGHSLVRFGRAEIASKFGETDTYSSPNLNDIEYDVKYIDEIQKLQIQAVLDNVGMFADLSIRHGKKYEAFVNEVEADINKSIMRKIFEYMWRTVQKARS